MDRGGLSRMSMLYHPKRGSKINKGYIILGITYFILLINSILTIKGVYNSRWAFIPFIIAFFILLLFNIDSRFLIFPAILLLAYCPFLLIAKEVILAENIAILAFYFLIGGCILQILEYLRKKDNSLDFSETMKSLFVLDLFSKLNIIILVVSLAIWLAYYRLPNFVSSYRYHLIYLLLLITTFNLLSKIYKKYLS